MMCHDRRSDICIMEQIRSSEVDKSVKVHREIDSPVVDSLIDTQRKYLAEPSTGIPQDRKPLWKDQICRETQLRIGNYADCADRLSGLSGKKSHCVWMQVMDSAPQLTIPIRPQGISFAEIDVTNELKCLLAERLCVCDKNDPVILRPKPVFIFFK